MAILSSFLERHRYEIISPYIQGDILDFGCGYAKITPWLNLEQCYVGIESQEVIYQWLIKNRKGYKFYRFDLDYDVVNINQRFNTILLLAVIEHLENPSNILDQIHNLIEPKGKVLITTPTIFGNAIHSVGSKFNIFSKAAAEEHEIIYTYKTLKTLVANSGLQVEVYRKFLLGGNQFFVCSLMTSTA